MRDLVLKTDIHLNVSTIFLSHDSWVMNQTWPTLSSRLRPFVLTCEFISISEIPIWLHIDYWSITMIRSIWFRSIRQSIHEQQTVQIDNLFRNAQKKFCCLENPNCDFWVAWLGWITRILLFLIWNPQHGSHSLHLSGHPYT